MFNATSVEARDWSEAGFYLAEASERSGPCVDQRSGRGVDARDRGRGDIESSSTDTHTNCVRRDGAGAWGVAGGRLNGS